MGRGADPEVAVLGAGAVGIATAIHLELAGFRTAVYADRIPFEDDGGPTLATPFAAASVVPSTVEMTDLSGAFTRSQAAFALLAESGAMGVRRQRHFDLAEVERPRPPYADAFADCTPVEGLDAFPRRSGAGAVSGWRFDVFFAETPTYLARCHQLYRSIGGEVRRRTLDRAGFLGLPADVLVNCAGLRARELVDDPRPVEANVGHQVLARGLPPVRDPGGHVFSYSYTAADSAPSDRAGLAYAYPRTDALLLGGSQIPAEVEPGEPWDGAIPGPTRTIDGVDVPARVVEANADLLAGFADVDLGSAQLTARYGYRPVRDLDGEGVRIEREVIGGRPVVHNYGHGGAGVTLSWGSAARVAALVAEDLEPSPRPVSVRPEFAVARRLADRFRA